MRVVRMGWQIDSDDSYTTVGVRKKIEQKKFPIRGSNPARQGENLVSQPYRLIGSLATLSSVRPISSSFSSTTPHRPDSSNIDITYQLSKESINFPTFKLIFDRPEGTIAVLTYFRVQVTFDLYYLSCLFYSIREVCMDYNQFSRGTISQNSATFCFILPFSFLKQRTSFLIYTSSAPCDSTNHQFSFDNLFIYSLRSKMVFQRVLAWEWREVSCLFFEVRVELRSCGVSLLRVSSRAEMGGSMNDLCLEMWLWRWSYSYALVALLSPVRYEPYY